MARRTGQSDRYVGGDRIRPHLRSGVVVLEAPDEACGAAADAAGSTTRAGAHGTVPRDGRPRWTRVGMEVAAARRPRVLVLRGQWLAAGSGESAVRAPLLPRCVPSRARPCCAGARH